ncbi:MAG: hypothetical protein FWH20_07765 [Oscillospiraceae bacterium]|nr:hypothetical protein [Oscillospiraceae bacterium]
MTFLAKCMKCNADMQVDLTEKEVICKGCLTPFIFERTMFNADMSAEAIILSKKIEKCNEKIALLEKDNAANLPVAEEKAKRLKSSRTAAFRFGMLFVFFVATAVALNAFDVSVIISYLLGGLAAGMLVCRFFAAKNEKDLIIEIAPIEARIKINREKIAEFEAMKAELMDN